MVGGGSGRDEGSLVINNTNVFAALETLRKKKKSDEDRGSSKKSSSKSQQPQKETDPHLSMSIHGPMLMTTTIIMLRPHLSPFWDPPSRLKSHEDKNISLEDSESEEDILEEGDDVEEDHDHEPEVQVHPEPVQKKDPEVPAPAKEAERQLSKRGRKRNLQNWRLFLLILELPRTKETTKISRAASMVRQLKDSEMAMQWTLIYKLTSRLRVLLQSTPYKRLLFEYSATSQD